MALNLEAIKARDAAVHSQTEDEETNLLLAERHALIARVEELEELIRNECRKCREAPPVGACAGETCALYPYRGGE